MFINRVASRLLSAPELTAFSRQLSSGFDVTLAVAQGARPLVLASIWAQCPRPTMLVVAGEEAADRTARALAAWLGNDVVSRYPDRRDYPWSGDTPDDACIGMRCNAVARLAASEKCIVVASAHALLRRVPPVGSGYFVPSTFSVGDEVSFEEVPALLVGMGYVDTGEVDVPGSFHVHGDTVDVFPAQSTSALESVTVVPCRELAFTSETIRNAERALYNRAQENSTVAADLELIQRGASAPALERYLPILYGKTASPLEHISPETLVVLAEPRSLFDDCQHAMDDIEAAAQTAKVKTEGLYTMPRELDFGSQQNSQSISPPLRALMPS